MILDSTKLGVWSLDGDCTHSGLLKYALTKDNFTDSVLILTVSMSEPWCIVKSLTNWLSVITEHIDRLGVDKVTMASCEERGS